MALLVLAPTGARLASRLPACPIRSNLDLPCLTCGTTRAALALAALDLPAALAVNPLATLAWLGLIGGGLVAGFAALVDRPLPAFETSPGAGVRWAGVAALLLNWAYLVLADV